MAQKFEKVDKEHSFVTTKLAMLKLIKLTYDIYGKTRDKQIKKYAELFTQDLKSYIVQNRPRVD